MLKNTKVIKDEIALSRPGLSPYVLEISDDIIILKAFVEFEWDYVKIAQFNSKEAIDSFIKPFIIARDKTFGTSE